MSAIRQWLVRLRGALLPRRGDSRLEEEIRTHLDALTDEFERGGMPSAEARLAARRAFGHVELVREHHRDARGLPSIDAFRQDMRIAVRMLRRQPATTAMAVVVLALGIGANNVFFTFVNAICLRGLPLADADRVVAVRTQDAQGRMAGLSYADYREVREGLRAFAGLSAFASASMTVADDGHVAERFPGDYVSAGAFARLGLRPILGRELEPGDEVAGAPLVVVLDDGLWRTRFAGDPAVLGRVIRVDGRPATVVGVVPGAAGFPSPARLWIPLAQNPSLAGQPRTAGTLFVFGRLAEPATVAQAHAEAGGAYARLARASGDSAAGVRAIARPINVEMTADITNPSWVAFLTAGVLVVLIACATVANLLLMRAVHRAREIAVRAAIGATRGRLVRQMLTESAVLATLGGLVGLLLSYAGVRLLSTMLPDGALPYWMTPRTFDVRVFASLAAVCLGSLFAFGLAPALVLSRRSAPEHLHAAGRTSTPGYRLRWWSTALVGAEVGLTFVLLAAVGVVARAAITPAPGVVEPDGEALLTASIGLPLPAYADRDARMAFYDQLGDRMRSTRLVTSTAPATTLPLSGAPSMQVTMADRPNEPGSRPPTAMMVTVGDRYFETLGVPLRRGRTFQSEERAPGALTVVVNERFVAMFLSDRDPIGRRLRLTPPDGTGPDDLWLTIVGVAANVRQAPRPEPDPVVYVPFRAAAPQTAALLLRTTAGADRVAAALRDAVRAIDGNVSLDRLMTFSEVRRQATWTIRLSLTLAYGVTLLALVLALVGVHGLAAHVVALRTPEIAIRMALGASAMQVGRLILRRLGAQLGVGLAAGMVLVIALRPVFRGIDDPLAIGLAMMSITVAMMGACAAPLRRAIATDSTQTLRAE